MSAEGGHYIANAGTSARVWTIRIPLSASSRCKRVRRGTAVQENRAHAGSAARLHVLTQAVAHHHRLGRRNVRRDCSAARKMLGCGFISPCSDDDTAHGDQPSSSKCDWNDARQRCEFEISPMRRPARSSSRRRRRDIVVQLEVLAGRPLGVDLAGAGVEPCPAAAHLLEDVAGVSDENLGVVCDARRLSRIGAALATARSNRDARRPCRVARERAGNPRRGTSARDRSA